MVQKDSGMAPDPPGPDEDTDLVTTVEGPYGKAEVYEVIDQASSGDMRFVYQVRFQGGAETYQSLGEAYASAGERVGART